MAKMHPRPFVISAILRRLSIRSSVRRTMSRLTFDVGWLPSASPALHVQAPSSRSSTLRDDGNHHRRHNEPTGAQRLQRPSRGRGVRCCALRHTPCVMYQWHHMLVDSLQPECMWHTHCHVLARTQPHSLLLSTRIASMIRKRHVHPHALFFKQLVCLTHMRWVARGAGRC
jgi:hypothetical protein